MIDYQLLTLQNPWWKDPKNIESDPKIQEFLASRVSYQPRHILELALKPGAINIVFGPRQTGKSTALKLLIRQLLAAGASPQRILYFNCDALNARQDVIDLVVRFQESITGKGTVPEQYLFLDEVSSVAEWPYAVKWLADAGLLRRSRVILTGSSSVSLKKSGELMPGRRGGGKDVTLLPISFREYVALLFPGLLEGPLTTFTEIKRFEERLARKKIRSEAPYRQFLVSGGFLKTIDTIIKEEPMGAIMELYVSALKSELAKSGRKELPARQVVRKVVDSLTAETSYANVAEEAELGSKNTAAEYLGFLRDSFFLDEVLFYRIPEKRVSIKKNKKYYPLDPFLYWVFQAFITGSMDAALLSRGMTAQPLAARLAESFIASELSKRGYPHYFFNNSRELDFYLPDLALGIEVKYKDKIVSDDVMPLRPARRRLLVSRHTLAYRDQAVIVPVSLFGLVDWEAFRWKQSQSVTVTGS